VSGDEGLDFPGLIEAEHVLGLMGLQEAVATEMSQDPGTDGMLEALQKLLGKAGGFVGAEVGCGTGRVLIRLLLDFLEKAINHAQVVVEVRVQRRAEPMQETDSPKGG
jgi:hypothetical protein